MITLFVFMILLCTGVIRFAFRMAWGMGKLALALLLFAVCPGFVIFLLLTGTFGIPWIPAIIAAWFLGRAFRRAV